MKHIITILLLLILTPSFSQEMKEGFTYLEEGQFARAEDFFENVLKTHANNKTALICYGRAVGLAGEPSKALEIFNQLLNSYAGDQEVLLNKAEAFLWDKNPAPAIAEYQKLLAKDSTIFAAILGIANSYSMNLEYAKAYEHIQMALANQPDNEQAKISAKFIRLGYANELAAQHQNYDKALSLINENLTNDSIDQQSLALLSNVYVQSEKYELAESIYSKMENPIDALLGQSISKHLMKKDKEGLALAKQALSIYMNDLNTPDRVRIHTHYISALLWNNKIKEAQEYSMQYSEQYPDNADLKASQAEVAMYEADFKKGIKKYNKHLEMDAKSFKGNLGRADAFHALGMDNKAYRYAFETLGYYPGQKDVNGFISRLNQQHSPAVSSSYTVGKSSDGSSFNQWSHEAALSINPLLSSKLTYSKKDFFSENETDNAQSEWMTFSTAMQINKLLKAEASYTGILLNLGSGAEPIYRSDIDFALHFRISKIQKFTVAYQNEIQDFNADLINQNLKTSHIALKNAMFWKIVGIGSYTELYQSFQSDGNRRTLLFTSLYKNIAKIAGLKTGLNYLSMAFKEQLPLSYFSPKLYNQLEVFTSYNYSGQALPFSINIDLAGGVQLLEGNKETTWRTKISIDKTVGKLSFQLSGAYSSISAIQTNGFSFATASAKVTWRISNQPIFFNKLTSN